MILISILYFIFNQEFFLAFSQSYIYSRVTRTLFAFAELTNTAAEYSGPTFDFDTIMAEMVNQVREEEN